MSSGLNFWWDFLALPDDKFGIYYDFNAYSGAFIPSVSGGQSQYYATVNGGLVLQNGSGLFSGQNFLNVNNPAALTGKNFSHIFTYERTGAGTGTLFSSLTSATSNSGYEIGVNNANKLFFRYNTGAPAYYTFDNILSTRNAVGITLSNSVLEFDHYNFNTRKFESQSFIIKDNLFFGSNQWTVGRGFSGAIDDWVYIYGNVSKNNRERLFSGFYTLLDLSSGSTIYATGYNRFQLGVLSGDFKVYTTGYVFYTGNIGYGSLTTISNPADLTLFGDFYDNCGGIQPLYLYQGITGTLAGDRILPITGLLGGPVQSGISVIESASSTTLQITGYLESGIPLYTGITGLQVLENVSLLDNCGNVSVAYTYNNLTGTVSGITFLPQTGLVTSWDTSLYTYSSGQIAIVNAILNTPRVIDARRITPYGYNALTYLWDYTTGETLEFTAFPNATQILNIDKSAGFDTVHSAAILDARYNSGVINFYLNGQFQHESGVTLVGDVYGNRLEWQGDYYLDANLVYGSGYEISDNSIYDYIANNVKGFKRVTGAGTYPLTIGTAPNKNFYLNGQKLYSGINYTLAGQTVTLIGGYELLNGILAYVERYPDEGSVLGVKNVVTGRFLEDTAFMIQNGIRYSAEGFVEHSSLDKIGGSNVFPQGGATIYNNEGNFWE